MTKYFTEFDSVEFERNFNIMLNEYDLIIKHFFETIKFEKQKKNSSHMISLIMFTAERRNFFFFVKIYDKYDNKFNYYF
jgi:hypothetical protein